MHATDPIFASIASHAKAAKAFERSTAALERLKERIDSRASEKRKHRERRLTCLTPYFDIGSQFDPLVVIKGRADIKREVWRAFDRLRGSVGQRAARAVMQHEKDAVAELERLYDAFQRAHRARRKAAGLTAGEDAVDQARRAADDALQILLETAPTTQKGLQALASHLAAAAQRDPPSVPWWAMQAAMVRLSKTV